MWAINDLSEYSANAILRDGTPVQVRAIRASDKQPLARHFDGLSSSLATIDSSASKTA
jgi:hypothetical protein